MSWKNAINEKSVEILLIVLIKESFLRLQETAKVKPVLGCIHSIFMNATYLQLATMYYVHSM